jgi:hypothetical protein
LVKSIYDCHEFLLIYLIVAFHGGVFLQEVCNWVEDSIIITLRYHSSRHIIGSVGLNNNIMVGVKSGKDRYRCAGILQVIESFLLFFLPGEYNSVLRREGGRLNHFQIIADRMMIEMSETQASALILEVARGFPIMDSSDLSRIHFHSLHTNDETQVCNFLIVEYTLF